MSNLAADSLRHSRNGEMNLKHGGTFVLTLRKIYGKTFAEQFAGTDRLSNILSSLDDEAHQALFTDFDSGELTARLAVESAKRDDFRSYIPETPRRSFTSRQKPSQT